jgi:DNA processing protein
MSKELLYILCANKLKEKELYRIFKVSGSAEEVEAHAKSAFSKEDIIMAKKQAEKMKTLSVQVTAIYDEGYPSPLKNIDYAPPILFYRGEYKAADVNGIGIVGSRNASLNGRRLTDKLIGDMNSMPITIVSGMALGIDTTAHNSALKNNLRTIAVLGSGLDIIYPSQNRQLFEKIPRNGAIFSEHPLGTQPLSYHFPKRNRIISGLSKAVVIVEASEKSGSLITARFAMEQNKDVYSFPRTPLENNSEGNNNLIKIGAKIVTSANDVLSDIFPKLKPIRQKPHVKVSAEEEKILSMLSEGPVNIDRLCFVLDMGPATLANFLLSMEMKGLIRELPGKTYIRD